LTSSNALLQEARAEKERLLLEKQAGRLLPFEVLKEVSQVHNRSVFVNFYNHLDNLASIHCNIMCNSDREKLAQVSEILAKKT
jgi:hypothetical protein